MISKPRRRRGEGNIKADPKNHRYIGTIIVDGKAHYVSAPTEDAALAKLAEVRVKLAKGEEPKTSRETLGPYLERWIKLQTKLEYSTWCTYEGIIRNHITPALGRVRLTHLRPMQLQAWIDERSKAGCSPRTVEQIRAVLRKALADAERWELVDRNVARLVQLPRKPRHELSPLTPDQVRAFLNAIRGDPFEALYLTAIGCGLRQGELLGLRWQDIDLDAGILHVENALARVEGRWVLKAPKTDKSRRTVALPAIVQTALLAHRDRQAFERRALLAELNRGLDGAPFTEIPGDIGLVFTRPNWQPLWSSTVTGEFQALLARLKLPHQRFHDLRHAAASLWIAQGVPLKDVSATLGHSQIGLTADLYTHMYDAGRKEVARRMDEILGAQS